MPYGVAVMRARLRAPLLLMLAGVALAGCGSLLTETTTDAAGVAGAGVASAITRDAAVGTAIGLGVASAANAGLLYAERGVHRRQQDSIAEAAGKLDEGEVALWSVSHIVPIEGNAHGQVAVARRLDGPGFTCKEIVFSVDEGKAETLRRNFFTGFVCLDGTTWHWATAEPATERWGALQ